MNIKKCSEIHERNQDPRQAYSVDEAPDEHLRMLEESLEGPVKKIRRGQQRTGNTG